MLWRSIGASAEGRLLGQCEPNRPRGVYDEAKRFAEAMTMAFTLHDVDTKIVRIFNTYGPRCVCHDGRSCPIHREA